MSILKLGSQMIVKYHISLMRINLIRFLFCWACDHSKERQAGIWLSFDDRSIEEWFELRPLFKNNNLQVTFLLRNQIL